MIFPEFSGSRKALLVVAAACFVGGPKISGAQTSRVTMNDFSTGSQYEDYLRALQLSGIVPLHQWSIRGFSEQTIQRMTAADTSGPWKLSRRFDGAKLSIGGLTVRETFNTGYAYGSNDGPVWAGRGLTSEVTAAVAGHSGPLSFTLAPMGFRASNRPFPIIDNGQPLNIRWGHGTNAYNVDLPQRFGGKPYGRPDFGNSAVRLDSRFVGVGASTANEWMGPATEYPFLLGNNAPGFPHIFITSGDGLNLKIVDLHARVMWGKLYQSSYSPVIGSAQFDSLKEAGEVRLQTSGELVVVPHGIPGLEIGISHFFHVPYLKTGVGDFWSKPFKVLFLQSTIQRDTAGADNQLASVFFRWVFPHSGFEIYGERGYEDQFYDPRDVVQDVDHERTYMLGFQKMLNVGPGRMDVLKTELMNYQLPGIARVRSEGRIYLHGVLRQGHTNRGQLLGTSAGVGAAAASVISWTRYSPTGKTAYTLRRIVQDDNGVFNATGIENPRSSDVIVAAGMEKMRFGRRMDLGAKVEMMQDYNRNFSKDVPNLNLQITARVHSW
jgi:hypothetical protein